MCLDGVVAPLHVAGSGHGLVSRCGVVAGAAVVCFVEAQSMRPAVVHVDRVVCDYGGISAWRASGQCHRHADDGSIGAVHCGDCGIFHFVAGLSDGKVCTMVAELDDHKFADAFLVFCGEVGAEFNQGLIGCWAYMPSVACGSKNACGIEHEKCQVMDCGIGDRVTPGLRNTLNLSGAFPKVFNGVIQGPDHCNAGSVGF